MWWQLGCQHLSMDNTGHMAIPDPESPIIERTREHIPADDKNRFNSKQTHNQTFPCMKTPQKTCYSKSWALQPIMETRVLSRLSGTPDSKVVVWGIKVWLKIINHSQHWWGFFLENKCTKVIDVDSKISLKPYLFRGVWITEGTLGDAWDWWRSRAVLGWYVFYVYQGQGLVVKPLTHPVWNVSNVHILASEPCDHIFKSSWGILIPILQMQKWIRVTLSKAEWQT